MKQNIIRGKIDELSDEFKRRRKVLGISQLGLSKHAKISQSIINKLENKKIDPNLSTVIKIDNALLELENKSNLTADKIMVPKDDILYLKPDTKLFKVVEIVREKGFSQFTVLDENRKLLGSIYEKTIFDAISDKVDIYQTSIKRYIEPNPIVVPPEYSVADLSLLFSNMRTRFVLVGKGGKIMGLITRDDLLKKR